jgi:L-ascorbate metabolism protein UlaG (beta-lactamase superfamily)
MKVIRIPGSLAYPFVLCLYCLAAPLPAQEPSFTVQQLTNREVLLRLTASNTANVRIDAANQLPDWHPFLTLQSTGVNQHLDTAAPYLNARFFRAEQLTNSNVITGDHLVTTNGDVVIHPMYHATLVLTWNGRTIYNDPDTINAYPTIYNGLPKADLILISHDHSDHFDSAKINAVTNNNTVIVVPGYVYSNNLSIAQRSMAAVLRTGELTNIFGIGIQAVAATNANHPPGRGNGYVLTLADKRFYFSGDTGAIQPLRTLADIDVAFVAMNEQFTMSVTAAADLVRAFRPKIVYPYHYQNNPPADLNLFKRLVGTDLGIEVRFRKWY